MDDSGDAAGASTPSTSSTPDSATITDANGNTVTYNPELEQRSWPRFLENFAMRVTLFTVAGGLLPMTLGMAVLRNYNVPTWLIMALGASSALSMTLVAILLNYVIKGKFTKHDLNVTMSVSAAALGANYTLNNQYTYLQLGQPR